MDAEQTEFLIMIQKELKEYRFRIHSGGGEDSPGLGPEDFCVEVLNGDPEKNVWIDWEQAGGEYTLSFCGMHDHFGRGGESVDEMLTLLRDILENRVCSMSVGCRDGQGTWRPYLCSFLTEEYARKEIGGLVSEMSLYPLKGSEARFRFWDSSGDRTVPVPERRPEEQNGRESLWKRIRRRTG